MLIEKLEDGQRSKKTTLSGLIQVQMSIAQINCPSCTSICPDEDSLLDIIRILALEHACFHSAGIGLPVSGLRHDEVDGTWFAHALHEMSDLVVHKCET